MVRKEGTHTLRWGQAAKAPIVGTLDYTVRLASKIPGPQYDVDRGYKVPGVKFGHSSNRSHVDEVRKGQVLIELRSVVRGLGEVVWIDTVSFVMQDLAEQVSL